MKRVVTLLVLLALAAGFYFLVYPKLSGTGVVSAQAQSAAGQSSGKATSGRGGGFPTSVVVAIAKQQTVPITKSAVGLIEPIDSVVLEPQVSGVVTTRSVIEGQMVKKGDVLFKLEDGTAQAVLTKDRASLARDQANLDSANADLQRATDLFKSRSIPSNNLIRRRPRRNRRRL